MLYNNTYFDASRQTLGSRKYIGTANIPFDSIASSERDIIRAAARNAHSNFEMMHNIDISITDNSIGSGLKLNVISSNKDFNKEVEEKWAEFTTDYIDFYKEMNIADIQRTLLLQRMVDGGQFIKFTRRTNPQYPFSIQLVEVDNLDTTTKYIDNGFIADGLVFDKKGRVQGYNFKKYKNPLWEDTYSSYFFNIKFVKKEDIIFFKRNDSSRSSQRRELSEYTQVINTIRYFKSFQDSTVESASARAKLIYAIESEGMGGYNLDSDGKKYEYLNGVYTRYLKQGEKLHVVDPTVAGTRYEEFHKNNLRQLAIGRGVSYELAMRDASSANFSSIRASIIQDHKLFDYNQMNITNNFLKKIYYKFIREMALSGRFSTVSADEYILNQNEYHRHQWIAPARSWVDPYKDVKALIEKYKLGVITLSDIAKSEGKDIADIIEERAKENEMMKKAGLIQEEIK